MVDGCIGLPSACTNNLSELIHNSPYKAFCSSYHNLYSLSREITNVGTATSLIELSVLGVLVNIPLSHKY